MALGTICFNWRLMFLFSEEMEIGLADSSFSAKTTFDMYSLSLVRDDDEDAWKSGGGE